MILKSRQFEEGDNASQTQGKKIIKVVDWEKINGIFGEHNWVNGKHRLNSGGYYCTHWHMVSANYTSKICHHRERIEGHKEDSTRSNKTGGSTLGKPHMWWGGAIETELLNDNVNSIKRHKLCKIYIRPHRKPHINDVIADSGAKIHWLNTSNPSKNDIHDPIGLQAIQPDGTLSNSNTKCDMIIKNITDGAKEAYNFKEMKENAIVSLTVLAGNGC